MSLTLENTSGNSGLSKANKEGSPESTGTSPVKSDHDNDNTVTSLPPDDVTKEVGKGDEDSDEDMAEDDKYQNGVKEKSASGEGLEAESGSDEEIAGEYLSKNDANEKDDSDGDSCTTDESDYAMDSLSEGDEMDDDTDEDRKDAGGKLPKDDAAGLVKVADQAGSAEGIYQCWICMEVFPSDEFLVKHMNAKCVSGQRVYHVGGKSTVLDDQIVIVENQSLYECKFCGKTYKLKARYDTHTKVCYGKDGAKKNEKEVLSTERSQLSDGADSSSGSQDGFAAQHSAAKQVKCDVCGKKCRDKGVLNIHMNMHNEVSFDCTVCGKKLSQKSKLKSHMKLHIEGAGYPCSKCDAVFPERHRLKKHMGIHTGIRPYKCRICMRSFSCTTNLASHLDTHLQMKQFKCLQCPRKFATENKLADHSVVHTDIRPYRCTVCPKGFTKEEYRVQHMKIHLKEKTYVCEVCEEVFPRRRALNSHMKSEHKEHEADETKGENSTDDRGDETVLTMDD